MENKTLYKVLKRKTKKRKKALRCEGTGEKAKEGHKRSADGRLPASEVIGEHTDHRRAEKYHPHRQSSNPC